MVTLYIECVWQTNIAIGSNMAKNNAGSRKGNDKEERQLRGKHMVM